MAGPLALYSDIKPLIDAKVALPSTDAAAGAMLVRDATTDTGTRWRPAYVPRTVSTLPGSTSVAIPDPSTSAAALVTLTANTAVALPTAAAGKTLTVAFQQDTTGGWTVSWPTNVGWPGGSTPAVSAGAKTVTVIRLECYDGINWVGWVDATNVVMPS